MTTTGDCLTPRIHDVFEGDRTTADVYLVELEIGRPGLKFWSTVVVAGQPTAYPTLAEARRKRSYLRAYDRRTFVKVRSSRIVKITVSRETIVSD